MLFVTVGSTYFDELVEEVDRLAGSGRLPDRVVIQRGAGSYEPKHAESFRFKPGLDDYYREAELVISHAAAGTLFTLLHMGKRVVAATNPRLSHYLDRDDEPAHSRTKGRDFVINNRQMSLPLRLEDEGYLVWCPEVSGLEGAIAEARSKAFKPYARPPCDIAKRIEEYLAKNRAGGAFSTLCP